MQDILELSKLINELKTPKQVSEFLAEILTESELSTLSKRWRTLKMLAEGATQREIATDMKVGLCKVTRGAKVLKKKDSITKKFLIKEKI